jgi:hypothetical protein
MWLRKTGVLLLPLIAAAAGAVFYGSWKWRAEGRERVERVLSAQRPMAASRYDARAITHLPAPVVRYFHHVLQDGQPLVVRARIAHQGFFNSSNGRERWAPFHSTEVFTVSPPAFIWDATIDAAPMLPIFVRDGYAAGRGQMRGALFGLVPVVHAAGTPELASGALMRYLAEAAWLPTALLPECGVSWTAIDDRRALATLTDPTVASTGGGPVTASLEFRFNDRNEIAEVYSPGRYRQVGDTAVLTPWSGVLRDAMEWDGMLVPTDAEVRWHMPDRVLPYWRGRLIDADYEFAWSD